MYISCFDLVSNTKNQSIDLTILTLLGVQCTLYIYMILILHCEYCHFAHCPIMVVTLHSWLEEYPSAKMHKFSLPS